MSYPAVNAAAAHEGSSSPSFDGFISYSRRDSAFATRLHQTLERYAPPKGLGARRGRLRVFRDANDFTGSEYHSSIEAHLAASHKLIVICSPASAASPYVDDEIERFARLHGAEHIVPVLWRGLPNNEATDMQADQRAFPPSLCRALKMPLAADFRGFDAASGRVDGEAYRGAWMLLLANLLGVSRAEIEQRELKRRRVVRRAWTLGLGSVFAALLALTLWALFEGERALARQLAAQASLRTGLDAEQVERRVLLARESALRLARLGQPTLDADTALRDALAQTPRPRLALSAGERAIALSGDGEYLLAAQGSQLEVHSLAAAKLVQTVTLPRPLRRLLTSANLRFVAGIDGSGALHAWSWPDFEPITAQPPEVAAAPLQCLAFSGYGATLITLRIRTGDPRTVELLRWRPGETRLIESASVTLPAAVRETPDERCLFARDPEGSVFHAVGALLEMPSGEEPSLIALRWQLESVPRMGAAPMPSKPIQFWAGVRAFELDQNTSPVVLRSDGKLLRESPGGEQRIKEMPAWSHAVALSEGGGWFATAEGLEDPYLPLLKSTRFDLFDTGSGAVMHSVADQAGSGAFTPDRETFATFWDKRIRLWDMRDGRERLRLQAAAPVQRLLFDASSRQLVAVAADGALEVFDIGGADESMRLMPGALVEPLGGGHRAAVVSGSLLLAGGNAGERPKAVPVEGHVHTLASSPDGRWLVLGTSRQPALIKLGDPPGSTLTLLELTKGTAVVRYRGPWGRYRFDRASRRLFVLGDDGQAWMIDLASGKTRWRARISTPGTAPALPGAPPLRLALADDGSAVAIGAGSGLVVLSGEDGKVLRRDDRPTTAVALSADGALLARPGEKDTIDVLRMADGKVLMRLDRRGVTELRELMFSPGTRMLMAIGGTTFGTFFVGGLFAEEHFAVWDLQDGRRVARIPESRLASSEYQATIGVKGEERQQLTGLVWNVHTREIAGTMFPSLLAYFSVPSSMVRGNVMAWRLTDQGLVESYRSMDAESLKLQSMAGRGGVVVAGGEDGYRRVIDLSGARLVAVSCHAVHRPLTADEQAGYLGSAVRQPMSCER